MITDNNLLSEVRDIWEKSTADLLSGKNLEEAIQGRAEAADYIRKSSEAAYNLLISGDAETAFNSMFNYYLFTSGSTSKVQEVRPYMVEEVAARWADDTIYKEISPAEAKQIEEEETRKAIEEEENKKRAQFDSIQTYNAEMIKFLKDSKKVIAAWDKKVFNKKFDEALDAFFPIPKGPNDDRRGKRYIYVSRQYNRPYIYYRFSGMYTPHEECITVHLQEEEGKQPRIDAATILKEIDSKIESIEARINRNNNSLARFNDQIKAAAAIKEAIDKYYKEFNNDRQFTAIYQLPYELRRYFEK